MIYKRGNVYWFNFVFNGKHIQKSSRQGNKGVARDLEAAERLRLIKGEAGIERKPVKVCPTLKDFKETPPNVERDYGSFMDWVRADRSNKRTQDFYETCYDRLCEFKELSKTKLSDIDEPMIERFKLAHKETSKTTVNRYLATLRKALRYACRKQKLIDKVPLIEMYNREDGAERQCEFVFSAADYRAWLAAAREPLRSASVLAHDGGICRGEMLELQRDCVDLKQKPDENGFWGTISIRRGLKRQARRRTISITEEMAAVLFELLKQSKCEYVFTSLQDRTQPLSANTLADQHRVIMETCSFHPDAGLHALRHTFLTEAGRHTQNVKALQKLAGHSRIETTMRYVHPDDADMLQIASAVQQARSKSVTTVFTTSTQQEAAEVRKM
ncbi:MAG TPA: tyrosine-type recombinase/integrase [Terriglobales bacterium]|jgi:integrase|nr:tyrosine-type recombinase/integrase [Terriglobales bacterium]